MTRSSNVAQISVPREPAGPENPLTADAADLLRSIERNLPRFVWKKDARRDRNAWAWRAASIARCGLPALMSGTRIGRPSWLPDGNRIAPRGARE